MQRLGGKHLPGAERLAFAFDCGNDHALGELDRLQQFFGLGLSLARKL